jgi:hypothetical protein
VALTGDRWMEVSAFALTIILTEPEIPPKVAVTMLWPGPSPATVPLDDTVATAGVDDAQAADEVTYEVEPSL